MPTMDECTSVWAHSIVGRAQNRYCNIPTMDEWAYVWAHSIERITQTGLAIGIYLQTWKLK